MLQGSGSDDDNDDINDTSKIQFSNLSHADSTA